MKAHHIPNILTVLRIILTPVFYYYLVQHELISGLLIFIIVALTDIADGYIARRFQWESKLGQALDPFADKFMVAFALIAILQAYDFPTWAIVPFLSRDIISVMGSLLYMTRKKAEWKPNILGKLTTLAQVISIVGYLIDAPIKEEVLWCTLLIALITAISYLLRGIRFVLNKE